MHPSLRDTWTPAVNVVTWFLLTTAILSVLTRLGTKYWIFRKWTVDDGLALGSLVRTLRNWSSCRLGLTCDIGL